MIRLKIYLQKTAWIFLLIAIAGYIISVHNEKRVLASGFFAGAFIMICLCIASYIIFLRYVDITDSCWICLAIVMLAGINVLIGSDIYKSMDYFGKVLRFDTTVMMIYICTKYKISKNIIRGFWIINQFLILLLVYQCFVIGETYYTYTSLTLGFPNPNHAGMWAMLCFCGVMWNLSRSDSGRKKFFYIAEMCLLVYLLKRTGCRSALLGVCGLIVLAFIAFIKDKYGGIRTIKGNFFNFFILVICFFPLVFSLIYIGLYYSNIRIDRVINQDFFSGREILWLNALLMLKDHFIMGVYNEVSLGTGRSQLHNVYIDVLCSYGGVVFLLFLIYILWIVFGQVKKLHTIDQFIAFFAFLMVFFIAGTYEAAYVSGDHAINYWTCLFLLFSNAGAGKSEYVLRKVPVLNLSK